MQAINLLIVIATVLWMFLCVNAFPRERNVNWGDATDLYMNQYQGFGGQYGNGYQQGNYYGDGYEYQGGYGHRHRNHGHRGHGGHYGHGYGGYGNHRHNHGHHNCGHDQDTDDEQNTGVADGNVPNPLPVDNNKPKPDGGFPYPPDMPITPAPLPVDNNKPKPDGGFPYPPVVPIIPTDNNNNAGLPKPFPDLNHNTDQNVPRPDNGANIPPISIPDTNQGGNQKPNNNGQPNQADPIDSSTYGPYDIDVRFGEEGADVNPPKPAAKA